MDFVHYNDSPNAILVDDEYGVVDNKVFFCVGDGNPDYQAEGYPCLADIPTGDRVVFCMPDVSGWNDVHYPDDIVPHRFSVADDANVFIRIQSLKDTSCKACDVTAIIQKLYEDNHKNEDNFYEKGAFDVLDHKIEAQGKALQGFELFALRPKEKND